MSWWRQAKLDSGGEEELVSAECDEHGELFSNGKATITIWHPGDVRSHEALETSLTVDPLSIPSKEPKFPASWPIKQAPVPSAIGKAVKTQASSSPQAPQPASNSVVTAYVAGSCDGVSPGPHGLGVVLVEGGQALEHSEYLDRGTLQWAELEAVGAAVAKAIKQKTSDPLHIHTDSMYCVEVLDETSQVKAEDGDTLDNVRKQLAGFPNVRVEPAATNHRFSRLARRLAADAVKTKQGEPWKKSTLTP